MLPKSSTKISNRQILFIFLLIILLMIISSLIKEILNRHRLNEEIRNYEEQIAQLQLQKSEMKKKIDSWSDSNALEKEARIKLGLQKAGEKVIYINRSSDQPVPSEIKSESKTTKEEKRIINPVKWWRYFFQ